MTFEDEVRKIYGKFIWILDDFRININHINNLHKNFIKKVAINSENMLKKSLTPKPKKKFFEKKSNDNSTSKVIILDRDSENKAILDDPKYSDLEKLLYFDKREYIEKYQNEFINNVFLYGTQSDFLYRYSVIYSITLYEGFNDKIFEFLESYKPEWFTSEKTGNRIKYKSNIDILANNFKSRYNIFDLETEFKYFEELKYFYYLRNILVHNLGEIDKKFIENIGIPEEDNGKNINVSKEMFNQLSDILIYYFMFIKETLIERKEVILN